MKTRLFSILSFLTGILTIIILFESFLNLTETAVPINDITPEKGERYYPGKFCNSLFISEGFGMASTNSHGWFGKDFYDDGKSITVAVIGNSYVASRQVFYRDNFLSVAESEINRRNVIPKTELFSFGKEYMTLPELLFVKDEISNVFNPDYILILINDYSFEHVQRFIPYYELINDSLILNTEYKTASTVKLFNKYGFIGKSSFIYMIYRVKNNFKNAPSILFDKLYSTKKEINSSSDTLEIKILSNLEKKIFEKLVMDKKVIFLLDIHCSLYEEVKALLSQAKYIDLREPLYNLKYNKGIDPCYWKINKISGHWNHEAHKVIGSYISDEMIRFIEFDKLKKIQ